MAAVAAGCDVDLHQRCLRCAIIRQPTERAAAWWLTNSRLSPALALNWDTRGGAKVLVKLIWIGGLVSGGPSKWKTSLAPGLRSVLVLGGAELASCLSLLLQRLLLLCVGISDLDLEFFAAGHDSVVVEGLDHLLAGITRFEADRPVSDERLVQEWEYLPGESNTAAMTAPIPQDAGGAHLVRSKQVCKFLLIHRLREIRNV